jgi:hypothetical protein
MKRLLIAAALTAATAAMPVSAADVGISLSIGQPGFYGQIDIGDYPQPRLIYRQPIVIERVTVERPPVYLRVPPVQRRHWSKYCRKYNACGERVYFVQDSWYNKEYVPRYQEKHRNRGNDRRDDNRDDQRGNQGNNRHDNGKGKGRGN